MLISALYLVNNKAPGRCEAKLKKVLERFNVSLVIQSCSSNNPLILPDEFTHYRKQSTQACLVFIDPSVIKPLLMARQVRNKLNNAELIFLVDSSSEENTQETVKELSIELHSPTSPIGKKWAIHDCAVNTFEDQIEKSLRSIRKQNKFRTTLSHVHQQLQSKPKSKGSELQRYTVSLKFLSQIIDHLHDGIIATTSDGTIVKWNKASEDLFKLSEDDAIGKSIFEIHDQEWSQLIHSSYDVLVNNDSEHSGPRHGESYTTDSKRSDKDCRDFIELELAISTGNDEHRFLNITLSVIKDNSGEHLGVTLVIRDITEKKATENVLAEIRKDLEKMSYEDGLTGVANRRMFDQTLHNEWNRMLRTGSPLAIIMFDIDFFKPFNDHYGHQKGDQCLKQVANILKQEIKRSSDLLARYGGEEFIILLPDTDCHQATVLAKKCCTAVYNTCIPHEKSEVTDRVTISGGVNCDIPTPNSRVQDIIKQADDMLYEAKSQGRNQIRSALKEPKT